ncbi:MAG: hypothetical protein AB3N28_10595, partial [Kordiimonas sp.]
GCHGESLKWGLRWRVAACSVRANKADRAPVAQLDRALPSEAYQAFRVNLKNLPTYNYLRDLRAICIFSYVVGLGLIWGSFWQHWQH